MSDINLSIRDAVLLKEFLESNIVVPGSSLNDERAMVNRNLLEMLTNKIDDFRKKEATDFLFDSIAPKAELS